jgi:hypothetical protein
MRFLILGALVVANFSGAAPASEAPSAYEMLKTAPRFTIGHVGYAGVTSKTEAAFRSILKEPKPQERLVELLSSATPAGQLYALLGLKLMNDPAFEKNPPRYNSSKESVETMSGCIVQHSTVKSIAWQIRKGQFK